MSFASVGEGQCEDVLFFVLGSRGVRRGQATILVRAASWVGQHVGSPFGTSSWVGTCVNLDNHNLLKVS